MMVAFAPARRRSVRAVVFVAGACVAVVAGGVASGRAQAETVAAGEPALGVPARTAALMRPARAGAPMGEIRLQPQPGCVAGGECAVTISADLRPVAGDRRRVAIAFDWPAATAPKGEGGWHCRPLTDTATLCFGRPDDIMANPASRLLLRVPTVADGQPEPKLCPRAVDEAYRDLGSSGGVSADARQVRLLQAFADEARGAAAVVPDGIVAGETRQAFLARAREIGLPTEPDSVLVAALVGQEINRAALTLPACVALITPAPAVARTPASDAASVTPRSLKPPPPRGGAVANGGDLTPPAVAPVAPPMQLARPPVYAPAPFDDGGVLLRPWRIRPLNGLRRLFGG